MLVVGSLGNVGAHAGRVEYAALVRAAVWGLAEVGERTVIVAEVAADLIAPGEDSANGECLLLSCPTSAMTSWFCDARDVDVTAAAAAAKEVSPDLSAVAHTRIGVGAAWPLRQAKSPTSSATRATITPPIMTPFRLKPR